MVPNNRNGGPAWWRKIHRPLLFLGGAIGLAHEEFVRSSSDRWLLIIYGGMLGIPGVVELLRSFRRP